MESLRSFIFPVTISFFIFLGACTNASQDQTQEATAPLMSLENPNQEVSLDLSDIQERDTLNAILTYSSSSYFIYKGEPLGYEYELVQRLADALGLHLNIVVARDMDKMVEMLKQGKGDLIAHGLTITKARQQSMAFTQPHNRTQQVLVQKKPSNWRQMKLHEIDAALVKSSLDLIGKQVFVRGGSAYYDRLLNLSDEIGGDIDIQLVSGEYTTDELIEQVAYGEIPLTVADENIAMINQTYYDQIDIETSISLAQQLAWAVRKSSPELLEAINNWIASDRRQTDYYVIYNKYFKNKREFRSRMKSDFFSKTGGKLSPYDDALKQHAESLDWDWRLLASQMYQESRFDPNTSSWAGAQGLMQVMPATGKSYGVDNLLDPNENIRAGISYLKTLKKMWAHIPDSLNRIKFTLASYNAGPGHVLDAQRIAEKLGKNPEIWDENVAESILLKAKPEYYNDEVVKYGYCRGSEPYAYVRDIMGRYEEYKLFLN